MSANPPQNPPQCTSQSSNNGLLPLEVLLDRLLYPNLREEAIQYLCKKKDSYHDLARRLWHSPTLIAVILQEIIMVYPLLTPTFSPSASARACNAVALLQVVAVHPATKFLFLRAQMPLYLFAFLHTTINTKPIEELRLTTFAVVGALLKRDNNDVVSILLQMEIMPLCMQNMDIASLLSKELATYIVLRILLHHIGLEYICSRADRFFALCGSLRRVVVALTQEPSAKLLRKIVRCYLRLADHPRACQALHDNLPVVLRNGTFDDYLTMQNDHQTWSLVQQLIVKVA